MYSDSHVHTAFSGDCDAPVKKQIEAAIARGMKELCITDHHDYDVDSGDIDFNLNVETYLRTLKEFQELYKKQITLRIGIEFGQQPHLLQYERDFFANYSFDFVIGATHSVEGIDPYYPEFFENRTEHEAYQAYFAALLHNLKHFNDYDTAAHLDYIVRYGSNKNRFYHYDIYRESLDQILKTLIQKGKALECNTSGLRQGLGQPHPSLEVLKRYRELGGELLTIGSDAHESQDIGDEFETIGQLLKQCGFSYYTTFANRKPLFHRL